MLNFTMVLGQNGEKNKNTNYPHWVGTEKTLWVNK